MLISIHFFLKMPPSLAWQWFVIDKNNPAFAICKCGQRTSRGGQDKDNFGTTGLLNHIKVIHKSELQKYKDAKEIKKLSTPPLASVNSFFQTLNSTSNASKKSSSSSWATRPIKRDLVQPTVYNCFEKKKLWTINSSKSMECHRFVGQFIALNFTSFRMVESEGFRQMLNFMIPQYKIPSRIYFANKIIPSIYFSLKHEVRKIVDEAEYITMTSDGWTSKYSQDSFVSFTGHCINMEGHRETVLLHSKYFTGKHTSENITALINSMISDYGIPRRKIVSIVTDNASNITKAVRDADIHNLGCFLHTMQLAIGKAILKQDGVETIVTKCRKIVSHMHRSGAARSLMKHICMELEVPNYRLVQDVVTR